MKSQIGQEPPFAVTSGLIHIAFAVHACVKFKAPKYVQDPGQFSR
jgi:hypothetical protein